MCVRESICVDKECKIQRLYFANRQMANCTLRRTMWKSEGAKRFKNVWVISNNNVYENHTKYITYFNYRAKVKKKKKNYVCIINFGNILILALKIHENETKTALKIIRSSLRSRCCKMRLFE